jgi:hypothetical protein
MDREPGELRLLAKAVVAEIDGAALRRDARRAWAKRSLRIGPDIDGVATVSGHLTSEAAACWRARTEPYMRPLGPDDRRSAEQRLHDAALSVMTDEAGAPGLLTHVVITAPVSAVLGEEGPPALLGGLVPISREELDQCLCEGDLTLLLRDAKGNLAFQGRRARTFSPAKRRAIVATHPGCVWPGCGRRITQDHIHHLLEFNRGGETLVDDGAPLCRVHHSMLHREGWALLPRADGTFRAVPPGDPENPRTGMSPDEYMRRRMRAIAARKQSRRKGSLGKAARAQQSHPRVDAHRATIPTAGPAPPTD